jgi:uncharacterized iron-regulated membrane protein
MEWRPTKNQALIGAGVFATLLIVALLFYILVWSKRRPPSVDVGAEALKNPKNEAAAETIAAQGDAAERFGSGLISAGNPAI